MSYVTVFEITREAIPLWIPLSFLIFGLFATIGLLDRNLVFVSFALLLVFVCAVFAAYYFHGRRHDLQAYRNGKYKVVEGPVEHYSLKGKTECFSVRGVEFCHGTANQVGWDPPLRLGPSTWPVGLAGDGLPVRVAYFDELIEGSSLPRILRLEIVRP